MDDSTRENFINEILAELSECREDERSSQNQILTIISTAATVLGILFGSSFLNKDLNTSFIDSSINVAENSKYLSKLAGILSEYATFSRVIFILSAVVFCTAFAYIIVLGINNVIRYYYIQNLEDRLHALIKHSVNENGMGDFLHWNAYSAPIITKNPKHIASSHTALSYVCYSIATGCAIIFSMGMVIFLFLIISPIKWFDWMIMIIISVYMVIAFYLFMRLSVKANEVYRFAWDTAHENQKLRLSSMKEKMYGNSKNFRRTLLYFLYPKLQDPQKPALIVLGFFYGFILANIDIALANVIKYVLRLIFIMFVFDFLAYQARYQINDIRGIEEDFEAGCKTRLPIVDINQVGHMIKMSGKIALFKIISALLVTAFWGGEVKELIFVCLSILFASTVLYEVMRKKKITWLIFITVGIGYPLRFFLGFFAIAPVEWLSIYPIQIVCFALAACAYGSFASILSWVKEVTKRMQKEQNAIGQFPSVYQKKHYMDIQKILRERYVSYEKRNCTPPILPLREKCSLRDPWNIGLLTSLILLLIIAYLQKAPIGLLVIEMLIVIFFIISIYLRNCKKLIPIIAGLICFVGKIAIAVCCYKLYGWYLLLSTMQLLIAGTYFILCYQPQPEHNMKDFLVGVTVFCVKLIYGDRACEILIEEKRKKLNEKGK